MEINIKLNWSTAGKLCATIVVPLLVVLCWYLFLTCLDKETIRYVLLYVALIVLIPGSFLGVLYIWFWIWD